MRQASFSGFEESRRSPGAIGFTRVTARVRYLETEQERLLGRVAAARRKQERLVGEIRAAATTLAGEVEPIMAQLHRLDREIHGLFRELLDEPRRAKKARARIRALYQMLQRTGTISDAPEVEGSGPVEAGEATDAGTEPFAEADDERGGGETAARPTGTGELRALFRRLAEALHPDKAADDVARAQRTEVMKEITAAYHAGDYSRLLAIEADAAARAAPVPGGPEREEERCAALERTLAELRHELRELERAARLQRRSPEYHLAREMKRPGGKEAFLEEGRADVESARGLRDFVASFRDGKIDLATFVEGPAPSRAGEPDEPDDELEVLMAFLEAEVAAARPRPAARGKTARRRRR